MDLKQKIMLGLAGALVLLITAILAALVAAAVAMMRGGA